MKKFIFCTLSINSFTGQSHFKLILVIYLSNEALVLSVFKKFLLWLNVSGEPFTVIWYIPSGNGATKPWYSVQFNPRLEALKIFTCFFW